MDEANVLFTLDGMDLIIQCTFEEKMRDICQKYASKIEENLDSLAFFYEGNQINFELLFKNQANSLDKANKKMKVLVYKNEGDIIKCPKCNEKIKLKNEKIDDIISSNEFILDTLNGIKVQLDNIIIVRQKKYMYDII